MQEKRVDELIAMFNEQSNLVKENLDNLLEIVKDGRVPSAEAMSDLETNIFSLNQKYDDIYDEAKTSVLSDDIPDYGDSVNSIEDALINSRARIMEEQLQHARETLQKFLTVKSMIDEYAQALSPYQVEVAETLKRISIDNLEEILPKIEAPERFLHAVDSKNIHSSDGIELMKSIKIYYPEDEISYGLIGKKYFYDQKEAAFESVENDPEEMESVFVPLESQPYCPTEEFTKNQDKETVKAAPISSENNGYREDDQSIYENNDYNMILPVENKVKPGTPSASAFKKDVIKLGKYSNEIKSILPLLALFGVMSKIQILEFGICLDCFKEDDDSVIAVFSAVDKLDNKGYLSRLDVSSVANMTDPLYCLSGYCAACMRKESVSQMKNFWALPFGEIKYSTNTGLKLADVNEIYIANSLLIIYLSAQQKYLPKRQYDLIKNSFKWMEDHYQVAVLDNEILYMAYIVMPYSDVESLNEENIIINMDLCEIPEVFGDACQRVFIVNTIRNEVYQLNSEEDIRSQLEDMGLFLDGEDNQNSKKFDEKLEGEPILDEIPSNVDLSELDLRETIDDNHHQADDSIAYKNVQEVDQAIADKTNEDLIDDPGKISSLMIDNLIQTNGVPTDEEFCVIIHGLLQKKTDSKKELIATVVQAVLLSYGASLEINRPVSKQLSIQLQLATNLLFSEGNYSSDFLATTFSNNEKDVPAMTLAAYMYAMLKPATAYDYGLKSQTEGYLSDFEVVFDKLDAFKPLFNKLMRIRNVKAGGFTPAVIASLGNEAESEKFLKELRTQAKNYLTVIAPKTRIKGLPIMYADQFGSGSDLCSCMEIIANGKKDVESLAVVEMVLEDFCDNNEGVFSVNGDKIQAKLNSAWDKANSKNKFKLEFDARDQALRQYRIRINVMISWVEHICSQTGDKNNLARMTRLRDELIDIIKAVEEDDSWKNVKDANVLAWMLWYMETYLSDELSDIKLYEDLLYTGIFSLTEDGKPEIDLSFSKIKYYEIWRNALKHIIAVRKNVDEIVSEILGESLDGDNGLKDNLRQLSMLGEIANVADDTFIVTEQQKKEAKESADIRTEHFKDELELAYTYSQINETEKETIASILTRYKSRFYEVGDFACWRRFIEALESQIREFAEGRKEMLNARLTDKLLKDSESSLLLEAKRLLEEESNFAVTEEYLNRYETGECELDKTVTNDNDYFNDFLSSAVFDPLFQECIRCKGRSVKSFGWNYLDRKLPNDWTARLRENSKALVSNWPSRKDHATPVQVEGLFKGLGLPVEKVIKVTGKKEEMWQLVVKPTVRSLADYMHPIAAFGTQMKSPIDTVFLYGNYTEKQLVDTITSMNLGGIALVLIDRPFSQASRRNVGEIFHTQTSGQNPFLLIDQVLFIYLAMHQPTERLPAMLKCTLPYSTYQPFVRDGGSTADEMFCGRTRELATIIDPNGACVVYGGRQLGKTALLERAESRCSKPENKSYAVYTTIIRHKTEKDVVKTLVSDIMRKTDGAISIKSCDTLRGMCTQLGAMFRNGQINTMHLLIDEVDDFLAAIAPSSYRQIQPLVDLKRETKNNFKFVIAGLHNVCRAKNATRDNGIFGQLGTPLCIKPLSPTDALQLLSKPLRYLGFQIDRYPHLETILTNTNYYPGILQFFGYILVETLTGQYSKYYSAANLNPPFTLQDEQLGAVMNSSDLNKSIKDKFRWSLALDPRYFMLARCITMLYHIFEEDRTSGSWQGFPVDDIMEMANEYEIHCLESVSRAEYVTLLDEMVEMGILGKPNEEINVYRLRRSSFVDIIGENMDALEAEIIENNLEE